MKEYNNTGTVHKLIDGLKSDVQRENGTITDDEKNMFQEFQQLFMDMESQNQDEMNDSVVELMNKYKDIADFAQLRAKFLNKARQLISEAPTTGNKADFDTHVQNVTKIVTALNYADRELQNAKA